MTSAQAAPFTPGTALATGASAAGAAVTPNTKATMGENEENRMTVDGKWLDSLETEQISMIGSSEVWPSVENEQHEQSLGTNRAGFIDIVPMPRRGAMYFFIVSRINRSPNAVTARAFLRWILDTGQPCPCFRIFQEPSAAKVTGK